MVLAAVPLAPLAAAPVSADYATISGTVTRLSDDSPVAGAQVIIHDTIANAYVATVTTAADGTFGTVPLPPSQYRVVPFAPGLALSGDGYRAALVRPHTDIAGIDFALDPSSTLTGTVATNSGAPVPNARVYLLRKSSVDAILNSTRSASWNLVLQQVLFASAFSAVGATDFLQPAPGLAFTAANGTYTIDGITPGTYLVRTSAPGRGAPADQTITIAAGANQYNPAFPAGATVEGTYQYSDGSPAIGRQVIADAGGLEQTFSQLPPSMTALPDAAGHYTLVGVRPGFYDVHTDGSTSEVFGAQTFEVKATTQTLTVDFGTGGLDSIEGTVRDAYGTPMANVPVTASMAATLDVVSTTTDANGHYLLDGLKPDTYDIYLTRAGYFQSAGDLIVDVPADTGTKAPPIVADMTMSRNHWAFGYVLDPDGHPASNAFIINAIDPNYYAPSIADTDGSYLLPNSLGSGSVVAESPSYAASLPLSADLTTDDVVADLQLRPLSEATVPGIPTGQVIAGVESITASVYATTDGGNPVSKLSATVSPGGKSCIAVYSCTIAGLKDDTVYKVSLYAGNAVGLGKARVLTVRTKPTDMPRNILSHRGKKGAAVIVFKTPRSSSGIRDFTLRYIDHGKWKIYKHKRWLHSPITVSGLKARTTYTGTLQAVTKVGRSTRSGIFYFTTG
jgi:protocatechuate 3,4-dioxygenase beta subunit